MGNDLIERWEGYNEQSWSERFAVLDAMYDGLSARAIGLVQHATTPPAGYVLVPRDPTPDMLDEGVRVLSNTQPDEWVPPSRIWSAMLSASPVPAPSDGWRPISEASKDVFVLLWVLGPFKPCAIRGKWDDDKYGRPPRPYWTTDDERITGKMGRRANQPTHFMPLPEAPAEEVGK